MKQIKDWMKQFKCWTFYVEDWDRGCIDRSEIEHRLKQVQDDAYKAGYNDGFKFGQKINGHKV